MLKKGVAPRCCVVVAQHKYREKCGIRRYFGLLLCSASGYRAMIID